MSTDKQLIEIEAAMRRSFSLGQIYWQQADSKSHKQNRKPNETLAEFNAYVDKIRAVIEAQGEPDDPMDWPLPCNVTVGHGTMKKGVKLRTLVARMKLLYEMSMDAAAPQLAQGEPVVWGEIEAHLNEYVEGYTLDGIESAEGVEGYYTPNEHERMLILDAVMGLTADDDFLSMVRAASQLAQPRGEPQRDRKLLQALAKYIPPVLHEHRFESVSGTGTLASHNLRLCLIEVNKALAGDRDADLTPGVGFPLEGVATALAAVPAENSEHQVERDSLPAAAPGQITDWAAMSDNELADRFANSAAWLLHGAAFDGPHIGAGAYTEAARRLRLIHQVERSAPAAKNCALCWNKVRIGSVCDACHDSMGTEAKPAAAPVELSIREALRELVACDEIRRNLRDVFRERNDAAWVAARAALVGELFLPKDSPGHSV